MTELTTAHYGNMKGSYLLWFTEIFISVPPIPSASSAWCINTAHLKGLLCLLEEYNHLWLSELQTTLCGHLAAWNEMEICREQSLKKGVQLMCFLNHIYGPP